MTLRKNITSNMLSNDVVRWQKRDALLAYPDAVASMEATVAAIADGTEQERLWLVEHPALYTAGTSAKPQDLVEANRFPVFATGRGGQYTYHGPGQRVVYVMLDLRKRGQDVRGFVGALERWIIQSLKDCGVTGRTHEDRVGVWVDRPGREDKIAALGIRVRRGITYHGISININPDLSHFTGIIPCGIAEYGVTSFADLHLNVSMTDLDEALLHHFKTIFGPIEPS